MGGIPEFGVGSENLLSHATRLGHDIGIPQQVAEPQRGEAGLRGSQNITRPAQLEVSLGDLETIRCLFENL